MTDPRTAFIEASFWHGSIDRANGILRAHPDLAHADIHTAAILGDAEVVACFLAADPAAATTKNGPRGVDALTHLCFSVYLQNDDGSRTDEFVRAAAALLDAGADPNGGFFDETHQPTPERESVLYGAAGVAHHAALTRLLLARGADPNDVEVAYHSPETYDNRAVEALLDSGRLTEGSLDIMLLRKTDWHDYDGVRLLLERGASGRRVTPFGRTALHHAILRDNWMATIDLLLDRGGDPAMPISATKHAAALTGTTAVALAARRGRADVLESIRRRGFAIELDGVERLAAACAMDDGAAVAAIVDREPEVVQRLAMEGGTLLAEFSGTGNAKGVGRLLDLGVPVDARYGGDPYFGIARDSTALHVAAWRAWQPTIEMLLARGADPNAVDGRGRTPLMLAVKACVDSYWKDRRTPDGVRALLAAGATPAGITAPTGYPAIDEHFPQG